MWSMDNPIEAGWEGAVVVAVLVVVVVVVVVIIGALLRLLFWGKLLGEL